MESDNNKELDSTLDNFDSKMRKARWISIAATIIPLVIALIILIILYVLIDNAYKDLTAIEAKKKDTVLEAEQNRALSDERLDEFNTEKVLLEKIKAIRKSDLPESKKIDLLGKALRNEDFEIQQGNTNITPTPTPTKVNTNSNITTNVRPTPVATLTPIIDFTIYIQIVNASHFDKARNCANKLREKKYKIPGIETITSLSDKLPQSQVRYFNKEDKARAEEVANILISQCGVSNIQPIYTTLAPQQRPMEIWFANNAF